MSLNWNKKQSIGRSIGFILLMIVIGSCVGVGLGNWVLYVQAEEAKQTALANIELGAKFYSEDDLVIIRFEHLVVDRNYFCVVGISWITPQGNASSITHYYFFHGFQEHIEKQYIVEHPVGLVFMSLYIQSGQDYFFVKDYSRMF